MSRKPVTVVLVAGAWYPGDSYQKVAALLEPRQYECVCVGLPSALSNPAATFLDDITAVRTAITAATTRGRDVVVVAHSYGGLPGHSASKGLTPPSPDDADASSSSSDGHVIGFVLLASGFTVTGLSFLDGAGGQPPPTWRKDIESGFAVITGSPRDMFFHDLPADEADFWVGRLGKQSLKALAEGGEHAYAAWMHVPTWYLATVQDHGLPIEAQRMFVQMARDAGADVTIKEVESSHSPMLSMPAETADFIAEAAEYFVGKTS